ncbi:TPA: NRDE family protein, partial [Klebsiella pneumoniae]
ADLQSLWALLQDSRQPRDSQLPDTGIGLEWERLLAPVFIRAPQHGYGTRASSQLRLFADGRLHLAERSFDSAGALLGECHVRRQALHESAGTR